MIEEKGSDVPTEAQSENERLVGVEAVIMYGHKALEDQESGETVDVTEFVRASQGMDPQALATEFDRDLERSIDKHRIRREQLELSVSV